MQSLSRALFRGSLFLLVTALAVGAGAQSKTFRIGAGGSAGKQSASVESVTPVETFVGRTGKVSGSFAYDASKRTGGGTVIVDLTSIDTGIPLRNEHMRSPMWLDTDKYPQVKFTASKVEHVNGDTYRVTGNFTLHGVTKPLTTTATVRLRPASAETKKVGFTGDVLQVRTEFAIKLSDFGVKIPDRSKGKVADRVKVTLTAIGTTG